MRFEHTPVLLNECIEALDVKPDGTYVDCTLGGGGHSFFIAKKLKNGCLIGIDQDSDAIEFAKQRLKEFSNKVIIVKDNFSNILDILKKLDKQKVDGILIDLGVSSFQLDTAERGFSYNFDSALDMRMNKDGMLSAKDVVNNYDAQELTRIFKEYGEERYSASIARLIVKNREIKPIQTTFELVDIIKKAMPSKALKEKGHPAKRVFQAIRIEVNKELDVLQSVLADAFESLKSGGVLAIITFHSLEDRMVKQYFKNLPQGCTCPKEFPICICNNRPKIRYVSKKGIVPSQQELEQNKRAKSAKLRAVIKL
jgi:16S rRNA (cytosine1402-N4)-methyltransferase